LIIGEARRNPGLFSKFSFFQNGGKNYIYSIKQSHMQKNVIKKEELIEDGMAKHAIEAFIELQKAGCPVRTWYYDDRGHFWLDAECESADEWLDYWNMDLMCGSEKLNSILEKHGLYWEWQNSAVGCVHDI
jgi:hypothetical protein